MKRFFVVLLGLAAGILLFPAAALADFGLDPGKVYIENLHPGAEADVPITVYNQGDVEATYTVTVRQPDYTETGYESFPHLDWVTVTPEQVTIRPRDKAQVMVVIVMPAAADYSGKKAETWVSIKEKDAPGMIQVELCSRLFISTRVEASPSSTPSPPAEPTPQPPEIHSTGSVGITAEAQKGFPVVPVVVGIVAVAAGAGTFFVVRQRRRA